ncbi:glycosyltransferase family 2 protein [Curtobacterium sp. MCBD17_032]|uniref:glycosyltransferase family 2 protein n=1 Tax=Curtobacterium sp. MCBD17_032 TaxID=2175659 RepID=UPI000DA79069|nr:glycosyltransferase family 2 protein [Curtobacterium sp. MCBD17_032]PZE84969.1 glycosyltransferase family 2 protein [Curtobacterium sp. MCBD17_032]
MRLLRGPVVRGRRRHRLREAVDRGARLTPTDGASRTAVVVVNWNRADLTTRAVRAVLRDGGADEVVVVDNGSSDDSVAVLRRELPGVTVVARPSNGGFAAGANTGIRRTDADLVVLLNNDAEPAPGFVTALRDHLDRADADVAAVTGRIVLAGRWARLPAGGTAPGTRTLRDHDGSLWTPSPDGEVRLNSTGVRVDRDGNGMDRDWFAPADRVADRRVFGFSGGAAAVRRTALDDVGLLDESLFMYYEDTELAWRFRRRGWRVEHAADAVVVHDHSASSGVQSDLFVFRNARNRLVVALWHAPWRTVGRAGVRTLLRGVAGLAGRGDRREARLVLAALADVVVHLPAHLARRGRESRLASVPRSGVDPSA